MILSIVLLVLFLLIFVFFIVFSYMVLFPAIKKFSAAESHDSLISYAERNYIESEKKDYEITDQKALVLCSCNKQFKNPPERFNEMHSCFIVKSLQDSGTDCKFACIGLGDCAKACAQEAISFINNTAVVSDLCCGCGNCVNICPQNIIKMVPKNTKNMVVCSNFDKNQLTSCDQLGKTNTVSWNPKKDFKIWSYCYKIISKFIKYSGDELEK